MKYVIVTDTHAGVRADSNAFADYQDRFWENVFFPKCAALGVNHILHGGDFFDKRQYLSVKTMERVKKTFCRLLDEYDMTMTLIVGNHDVLYKNTNEANSASNFFHGYDRVTVISEPLEIGNILLMPWINRENYERSVEKLQTTKAQYCLGHFEISGFEMHRGQVSTTGLDMSIFNRFVHVYSGHFHTRSTVGNISYLGSPFELTWSDYNDPRGFHCFDDETGEIEYFRNPESMFFRVEYDKATGSTKWLPSDPGDYKDKYIKVIVTGEGSSYELEQWRKGIVEQGPTEIQIIESTILTEQIDIEEYNEQAAKGNLELIREYIANLEAKPALKSNVMEYMNKLYIEAENK